MLFEVITSDGDVMPPFIFPQGLRFNMDTYIEPGEDSDVQDNKMSNK